MFITLSISICKAENLCTNISKIWFNQFLLIDNKLDIVNGQSTANNSTKLIWGDAQHEQKKLCARSCDNTIDIRRSKKLCFWKNLEKVFNWLNSTSWVEEEKGRLREKSREGQGFLFAKGQRGRKAQSFNQIFSRVKRRCRLVVRLKANKF